MQSADMTNRLCCFSAKTIWISIPFERNTKHTNHKNYKENWVWLNYATTHHHPPPSTTSQNISTTTHHQPKYIHHHPPPAKIYPPPPTTTHQQRKPFFIWDPFIRISRWPSPLFLLHTPEMVFKSLQCEQTFMLCKTSFEKRQVLQCWK